MRSSVVIIQLWNLFPETGTSSTNGELFEQGTSAADGFSAPDFRLPSSRRSDEVTYLQRSVTFSKAHF